MEYTDIEKDTAIVQDDELYNKETVSVQAPEREIGLDIKDSFYSNIIGAVETSSLDISKLESFYQISQNRDTIYNLFDTMCEDPSVAAVIETYAEDATEYNDKGEIVWCEADDPKIAKFVTFLLQTMNVDKNAYQWMHSLVKYGDLYLRLFHESDYKDDIFADEKQDVNERQTLQEQYVDALIDTEEQESKEPLQEDVKAVAYSPSDKFVHYLEMVNNPAEMFELTRFGKTYGYIQAEINPTQLKKDTYTGTFLQRYNVKRGDIKLYNAMNFVHATLNDSSSRVTEEISIFSDTDSEDTKAKYTYKVKRGQSLLYSVFKIWREMMLLENAMLLNRITKSSLVRVMNIEVGDMPKEMVGPHLARIKQLIEQKSAINEGQSLQEYTNPGPMENNIYVPTHNGQGTISTQQVGGDVDVKGLADIDYFRDKLYGALKVPKQMFGFTEDGAGFNGGQSLSILSSRYAKTIKRLQNAFIQAMTDAVNIMLIDKGLDSYINQFVIRMQAPTTQEELDRRDNMDGKVGVINNIMMLLSDVQDEATKLKVLKSLLSTVLTDGEILTVLQEYINSVEEENIPKGEDEDEGPDGPMMSSSRVSVRDTRDNVPEGPPEEVMPEPEGEAESPEEVILPTPDELGVDMTDNNAEV